MDQAPRIATFAALFLAMAATAVFAGEPGMREKPDANEVGIWKSYAAKGLKGEFHNYDPIGLIAGALIHTDCSINWTDPDDGRVYCFNSATSLVYFENWPKTYSRKAAEALAKMKKDTPEHCFVISLFG